MSILLHGLQRSRPGNLSWFWFTSELESLWYRHRLPEQLLSVLRHRLLILALDSPTSRHSFYWTFLCPSFFGCRTDLKRAHPTARETPENTFPVTDLWLAVMLTKHGWSRHVGRAFANHPFPFYEDHSFFYVHTISRHRPFVHLIIIFDMTNALI